LQQQGVLISILQDKISDLKIKGQQKPLAIELLKCLNNIFGAIKPDDFKSETLSCDYAGLVHQYGQLLGAQDGTAELLERLQICQMFVGALQLNEGKKEEAMQLLNGIFQQCLEDIMVSTSSKRRDGCELWVCILDILNSKNRPMLTKAMLKAIIETSGKTILCTIQHRNEQIATNSMPQKLAVHLVEFMRQAAATLPPEALCTQVKSIVFFSGDSNCFHQTAFL